MIAEDKSKIALIDLFRLLVLDGEQAKYILTKHWDLVHVCVMGYMLAQDMRDKEAKVMQNYHIGSLKFLANMFATDEGKKIMQDISNATDLIEFCSKSMDNCNQKVIYYAALVMFNVLLCFKESKIPLTKSLIEAVMAINKVISENQNGTGAAGKLEADTL